MHEITLSPRQLSNLRNGHAVQIKYEHLTGGALKIPQIGDTKKIQKAIKNNKGVRISFSPAEVELFSPKLGGKINVGKALKSFGKQASKGLNNFGEDLKTVPKYYRNNVRAYTQPAAKVLIEEGIPMLGSKLVEEGMKAAGADPLTSKLAAKAVSASLKQPAQLAFKKSGLGVKKIKGGSFRPA